MQLFADVYDEIVAFPKPTVAACHGDVVGGGAEIAIACDMRVGGSNLRMRFPARRSASRSARPAWSPSAASPPPSTCSSPRAPSAPTRRCASGLVNRVAPAAATEEAALELAAAVAAHPPEAVARLKRMLHEWDDVEGRSAAEGDGQVEWQRTRPGPAAAGLDAGLERAFDCRCRRGEPTADALRAKLHLCRRADLGRRAVPGTGPEWRSASPAAATARCSSTSARSGG